jgi:chromate transporter
VPVRGYGLSFEAPLQASADLAALDLAAAAVLAIFRFKFGMLWTLAGSCAAGIVLYSLGVLR